MEVKPTTGSGISIHSLVKRETGIQGNACSGFDDFNPLPRKEGDDSIVLDGNFSGHFNPLPRKEGDAGTVENSIVDGGHFNPLPRKEGDIKNPTSLSIVSVFQSTPS